MCRIYTTRDPVRQINRGIATFKAEEFINKCYINKTRKECTCFSVSLPKSARLESVQSYFLAFCMTSLALKGVMVRLCLRVRVVLEGQGCD